MVATRRARSGARNPVISQPTRSTASLTSASSMRSPPSLSPPGAGKIAGSTVGSRTSRSRCTNTGRPSSRSVSWDGLSTRPTPRVSSRTRSPASTSRTPHMTTRAGSRPDPRPLSQMPHAPARHMPPRKPEGVVSGELKSAWASSQSTQASGRWRTRVGSVVRQIEQSHDVRTG